MCRSCWVTVNYDWLIGAILSIFKTKNNIYSLYPWNPRGISPAISIVRNVDWIDFSGMSTNQIWFIF